MADSGSSLTPEKRLLNLIESGGKPGAAEPQPKAAPQPAQTRPAAAGAGRIGASSEKTTGDFFSDLLKKLRGSGAVLKGRFNLKTANVTARIALIVFIVGVIGNAGYEHYIAGKNPLEGLDAPMPQISAVNIEEDEEGQGAMKAAESRNVFLPFAKREEVQQVADRGTPGRLVEMTKALKLTGISFNPEDAKATYCMIEDLAKNITVFLRTGDQISGMRVSQIREESVELEYDKEKIEIR